MARGIEGQLWEHEYLWKLAHRVIFMRHNGRRTSPVMARHGLLCRRALAELNYPRLEGRKGGRTRRRCPGETTRSKKRSIVRLSGYHRVRYLFADKRTRDLRTVGEIPSTRWLNECVWLFMVISVNPGSCRILSITGTWLFDEN